MCSGRNLYIETLDLEDREKYLRCVLVGILDVSCWGRLLEFYGIISTLSREQHDTVVDKARSVCSLDTWKH